MMRSMWWNYALLFLLALPGSLASAAKPTPVLTGVCAEEVDPQSTQVKYRTSVDWGTTLRKDYYRFELVALDITGGYYPQFRDQNWGPGLPDRGFIETASKYPLEFFIVGMTKDAAKAFDRECAKGVQYCKLDLSIPGTTLFRNSIIIPSFDRAPDCAAGSGRFALVIGNGDYSGRAVTVARKALLVGPLVNAEHDAAAVGRALMLHNYVVGFLENASRKEILSSLAALSAKVKDGEHKLVIYFAGHGISVGGVPHIVTLSDGNESTTVSIDEILKYVPAARRGFNLVVLDMCRNEFDDSGTGRAPSRGAQSAGGVEAATAPSLNATIPDNTMMAFSTSANGRAEDGDEIVGHSPYADVLLLHLPKGGALNVVELMKDVHQEVARRSAESSENIDDVQRPRLRGKITSDNSSCLSRCEPVSGIRRAAP